MYPDPVLVPIETTLHVQDKPPVTDAEWEEALKLYGVDRHSETEVPPPGPPLASSSSSAEPTNTPGAAAPSPVVVGAEPTPSPQAPAPPVQGREWGAESSSGRQRVNRHFVGSNAEVHVLAEAKTKDDEVPSPNPSPAISPNLGSVDDPSSPTYSSPDLGTPRPGVLWPPPRQPDSFAVVGDGGPSPPPFAEGSFRRDPIKPRPGWPGLTGDVPYLTPQSQHASTFGAVNVADGADGLPRLVKPTEDQGHLSREAERRRLRHVYETEGWLPAPNPSQSTRVSRSAALRRLGLNGLNAADDQDSERHAVMMKYTELLQMFFGSYLAGIAILYGDVEIVYLVSSARRSFQFSTAESFSGHVVLQNEWKCFVVPDMDKDWRFANNPQRQGRGPRKFLAAAPLRYHPPNGGHVDFGCLCLVDKDARYEFSEREQAMMLRLSNMLVFQLATLQSEIMAKRTSGMYESSINFLRRSFIPEHLKETQPQTQTQTTQAQAKAVVAKDKEKKASAAEKKRSAHPHNHHRHRRGPSLLSSPRTSRTPSYSPAQTATPPTPGAAVRATKTGPKDTKRAKRKDLAAAGTLFSDAADTLRGILQADAVCMVDLHEFQLFIRKANTRDNARQPSRSKESIVGDFLQGKEWPASVEPVLNYVPSSSHSGVALLGQSCTSGFEFNFDDPSAPSVLPQFIKRYLSKRQFWWDRDDPDDELAKQLMVFLPDRCQTVLVTVFMTFTGTLKYATFAVWSKPPSAFDDSSRLALPFVWIIGAALVSSVALIRVRMMEESQITYSNLQAHELRTPLHQILAITQLLRSSMSDLAEQPEGTSASPRCTTTTLQQVRDLLPFLDAIDTSGKTLHGIVDNILTFLDLSARDNRYESAHTAHPGLMMSPAGAPQTLGAMLEELIHDANEEDRRGRIGSGQALGRIETVFEIIPRELGDAVTEDVGGALRRALSRVIHNAYRYIESQGCVEIYIDDVKCMLPPEGCEDLGATRKVSIKVVDNGRGMSVDFVRDKLGEPWAKEDLYATGSGLSVHLAYRIVDLMNGHMEITSAPGTGCTVIIEVPLPVTRGWHAPSPVLPAEPKRKVAFIGFDPDVDPAFHLDRLRASLERQYAKIGCEIVPVDEADLVIADGSLEDTPSGLGQLARLTAPEVVILAGVDDEALPPAAEMSSPERRIRRLLKPVTPALIRDTLARTPVASTPTDATPNPAEPRLRAHFADVDTTEPHTPGSSNSNSGPAMAWKPRGVCVEEAVASLCLGDYFSSRNRLSRASSNGSSGMASGPLLDTTSSIESRGPTETEGSPWLRSSTSPVTTPSDEALDLVTPPPATPEPHHTKVLVVEDNVINRKILVKILSAALPVLEILEAEDGLEAVSRFREFTLPVIVLLDINMPRMDGYAAAQEMRLIEKRRAAALSGSPDDGTVSPMARSKIIAVTALAGEDERRRGLVECGFDTWLTKPCPKMTLQRVVDEALKELDGWR